MKQIVIACGGLPTKKDMKEIHNLLNFKKRYKEKIKKGIDK